MENQAILEGETIRQLAFLLEQIKEAVAHKWVEKEGDLRAKYASISVPTTIKDNYDVIVLSRAVDDELRKFNDFLPIFDADGSTKEAIEAAELATRREREKKEAVKSILGYIPSTMSRTLATGGTARAFARRALVVSMLQNEAVRDKVFTSLVAASEAWKPIISSARNLLAPLVHQQVTGMTDAELVSLLGAGIEKRNSVSGPCWTRVYEEELVSLMQQDKEECISSIQAVEAVLCKYDETGSDAPEVVILAVLNGARKTVPDEGQLNTMTWYEKIEAWYKYCKSLG